MKRIVSALIVAALLTSLAGCSSSETLTGTAKGFGGTVTVTVTREGDKITDVKVDAPNETPASAIRQPQSFRRRLWKPTPPMWT